MKLTAWNPLTVRSTGYIGRSAPDNIGPTCGARQLRGGFLVPVVNIPKWLLAEDGIAHLDTVSKRDLGVFARTEDGEPVHAMERTYAGGKKARQVVYLKVQSSDYMTALPQEFICRSCSIEQASRLTLGGLPRRLFDLERLNIVQLVA